MATILTTQIELAVHDEAQFRQAAHDRALADGLGKEYAGRYLDADYMSLCECACMLLDPGSLPGAEIYQSSAETL